MRTTLAYSSARILLLVVASFVLLSRQRDKMSGALMSRIRTGQRRGAGFRARLEEGARAEDED
jgi:hypothetical protein